MDGRQAIDARIEQFRNVRFHSSSHQSLHYHYQVRRVVVRQFTMCEPTPSEGVEGGRFYL